MLDDPAAWMNSVRRFAVAIMLSISYGLEVDGPTSAWIKLADDSANAVGKSGAPASSIIDRFPASKSLLHAAFSHSRVLFAKMKTPRSSLSSRLASVP